MDDIGTLQTKKPAITRASWIIPDIAGCAVYLGTVVGVDAMNGAWLLGYWLYRVALYPLLYPLFWRILPLNDSLIRS